MQDMPKSPGNRTELAPLVEAIGQHLRSARKQRFPGDTQQDFARRIGVSHYTWRKMEKGDPGVAMGSYLAAAQLLGMADQLVDAFRLPAPSLFERHRRERGGRS